MASSEEALERFGRAFPALRVSAEPGAYGFALDYRRVVTEGFVVNRVRCAGRLRTVGPLPEAVAIGRRSAGAVAISRAGSRIDTSRPYLRPTASSAFEVRDGTVVLIALPPATVAEYTARSGSRGVSAGPVDRTAQLTALGLVMDHVVRLVDGPEAVTPQLARELQDLLCWSLLQAFEDPWADTDRLGARSKVLRRALSYIEEHADEVVTMPEVAAAARISVRSLGLLFREELDTTPFVWLRDLRLDRARLDLLDGRGTVGAIAARYGMPSGGRFAAQYRMRFKEAPAVTLRSGRAS